MGKVYLTFSPRSNQELSQIEKLLVNHARDEEARSRKLVPKFDDRLIEPDESIKIVLKTDDFNFQGLVEQLTRLDFAQFEFDYPLQHKFTRRVQLPDSP